MRPLPDPRPRPEAEPATPVHSRFAANAPVAVEAEIHSPRMNRRPSISCVLPCRNEAENLDKLLPRLIEVVSRLAHEWEIIVVDDGSTDLTPLSLVRWSQVHGVRALMLSRNFGKEAALTAGLEAASGQVIVTMDADLQHEPEWIERMLEHWQQGADVAYMVRECRRDEAAFKRWGSRLFYRLINASHRFEVPAGAGDFRLMDRRVVAALLSLPERNRFMKGLYAWVGFHTVPVVYRPAQRAHGSSHYSPLRLISLSLDGLTAFTTWPLRAISLTGLALTAMAIIAAGYEAFDWYWLGRATATWPAVATALTMFCGVQLFAVGIVGEYVGRIFEEAKGRPLFVVKREFGAGIAPKPQHAQA
jgi:glycosyltransferase involved in cell wall biosynthesis